MNNIKKQVRIGCRNSEWHTLTKEKKEKYLCAHCKTGVVYRLPANCPECNKHLNEEVVRRDENVETL